LAVASGRVSRPQERLECDLSGTSPMCVAAGRVCMACPSPHRSTGRHGSRELSQQHNASARPVPVSQCVWSRRVREQSARARARPDNNLRSMSHAFLQWLHPSLSPSPLRYEPCHASSPCVWRRSCIIFIESITTCLQFRGPIHCALECMQRVAAGKGRHGGVGSASQHSSVPTAAAAKGCARAARACGR